MSMYPYARSRRLRQAGWIRDMISEVNISPADLILPLFVKEGSNVEEPISTMPGVNRVSIDKAVDLAIRCRDVGIKAVSMFPQLDESQKDPMGSESLNPKNLMCRTIAAIKKAVPEIGVICDVALDPYTSHRHDGVLNDKGDVDNDITCDILAQQAKIQVEAGCDIIAPSDRMDGRIAIIRETLEENGMHNTIIMSYAAKYSSKFYGPFRDAIKSKKQDGSQADKRTYQMDGRNIVEVIKTMRMDVEEGADMLIVKPGMPYLDVIREAYNAFEVPIVAYQISGEYAMLKFASMNGVGDFMDLMHESMISFRRAGARSIFTYAAIPIAESLK